MSNDTGRYLKPARRVTTPAVVFSIAVEVDDVHSRRTDQYQERVFRLAAATVTKKRRGKWSIPLVIETTDCDELRKWIHTKADTRRRNYIICANASDVLTLTEWWNYAKAKGIRFICRDETTKGSMRGDGKSTPISVRRCLLRGKPDIFDIVDQAKRYVWLSGCQYIDSPEHAIGEAIGFRESGGLFAARDSIPGSYGTADRALMWSQFLCHLANWWSECATAPFGLTVGALAMGILRTHIKPKTLSTHKDEYAHKLERTACYGGRKSVWYVGAIGNTPIMPIHGLSADRQRIGESPDGPVRLIDVRSMYPCLLARELFPCRYAGRIGAISPEDCVSLASHYGIIASCTIYSYSGEYPYRIKDRLTYPRGYFQTVLTGPEIQSIKGKDILVKVHDGAIYKMGRPFKEAAEALLEMRIAARTARKGAWELFAKGVGVNLGGKLAQRRSLWKARPDVYPEREWGEWIVTNNETQTSTRFQSKGGLVFEHIRDPGGYGPYTPAFAYLTAYGRIHMRSIRDSLPSNSVLAQDTDGVWVLGDNAYDTLKASHPFGNAPGNLQVKELTQNCIFLGPQHYWTDAGWVLSGFHEPHFCSEKMEVEYSYVVNPLNAGTRTLPNTLIMRKQVSKLHLEHVGGDILPDGWVRPTWYDPPVEFIH